jgi:hypothetical protein
VVISGVYHTTFAEIGCNGIGGPGGDDMDPELDELLS